MLKNTGVLFANDCNKARVKGVVGNFHRLGITNSVITCYDGRNFPQVRKFSFLKKLLFFGIFKCLMVKFFVGDERIRSSATRRSLYRNWNHSEGSKRKDEQKRNRRAEVFYSATRIVAGCDRLPECSFNFRRLFGVFNVFHFGKNTFYINFRLFSDILERNNDYSDTLDFRKG